MKLDDNTYKSIITASIAVILIATITSVTLFLRSPNKPVSETPKEDKFCDVICAPKDGIFACGASCRDGYLYYFNSPLRKKMGVDNHIELPPSAIEKPKKTKSPRRHRIKL